MCPLTRSNFPPRPPPPVSHPMGCVCVCGEEEEGGRERIFNEISPLMRFKWRWPYQIFHLSILSRCVYPIGPSVCVCVCVCASPSTRKVNRVRLIRLLVGYCLIPPPPPSLDFSIFASSIFSFFSIRNRTRLRPPFTPSSPTPSLHHLAEGVGDNPAPCSRSRIQFQMIHHFD